MLQTQQVTKIKVGDGENMIEYSSEDGLLVIRMEGISKMTPKLDNAKKLSEALILIIDAIEALKEGKES